MFTIKQHKNREFDSRTWWYCPTCSYYDVAVTIFPESCNYCGDFLPLIKGLLERQTARAAYHFAEQYQK